MFLHGMHQQRACMAAFCGRQRDVFDHPHQIVEGSTHVIFLQIIFEFAVGPGEAGRTLHFHFPE